MSTKDGDGIVTDNLSPKDRKRTMKSVRGKGTKLEKLFWSFLRDIGLNCWRCNVDEIIGKPDVVFDSQQVAIFIDGCFWHNCPYCKKKLPKTNREYWERKIKNNSKLAVIYNERLIEQGWKVLRFWEHEVLDRQSHDKIKEKILNSLTG